MTFLQTTFMPIPIPISTDNTPLSSSDVNTLLGIFILLNIIAFLIFVLACVVNFILRKKDKFYYLFDFYIDYAILFIFTCFTLIIDAVVLICYIGYQIGKLIS